MPNLVGRSLGAMRSVANRARSTGGRVFGASAQATQRAGTRLAGYSSKYAGLSTTSRIPGARSVGKGMAAAGNFMTKYPKSTMGIGAAGIGYAGYRGMRGSQNSPVIGIE